MSLVLCACVLERERDERKCPAFCVIPVVTKTGDFLSKFFRRRRRRMMMMMTTMAICPSSSSMTTTTRSFSALQCWRRSGGARRRRCLLVVASKGRGERERDAFGERDVLKRLGKLKRAVAQNRTKDTVPTAETIGMRFSEVLLQSCSSSIYVVVVVRPLRREVVVAREFVFFTFFQLAFLLEERHPFVPYRSSIADRAVFLSFILCSMMMMMHKKCCLRQKTTRVFATTSSTTMTCRRRGTCRTRRRLLSRRIKSRKNVGWCTKR